MYRALWYICGLINVQLKLLSPINDMCRALDDNPVFVPIGVMLQAEGEAGVNDEPFHFIVGSLLQDGIRPPRTLLCRGGVRGTRYGKVVCGQMLSDLPHFLYVFLRAY